MGECASELDECWASARAGVADPVARAGSARGRAVVGVRQLAAVEGQAAATDALGQPGLQALQLRDALVDAGAPGGGELGPVAAPRHTVRGKLRELLADLVEA